MSEVHGGITTREPCPKRCIALLYAFIDLSRNTERQVEKPMINTRSLNLGRGLWNVLSWQAWM